MCKFNPSGMRDIITVPELLKALLVVYSLPPPKIGMYEVRPSVQSPGFTVIN
jgi:hypothetical protein